jgi:hypothetical protein
MKHFYPNLLSAGKTKSLFVFLIFLVISYVSFGQQYTTTFSGAAEAPPNASPGTGKASVTISGNFMRVQASFSGLLGNTTAAHIHAPTLVPFAGTAGVATNLPSFTNFPLGVRAGTYDHTFDMTAASSYNPSYITNNGGSPATAFVALKAAMAAGRSYFNIHSVFAPGGEIRGFLVACPTINVTIPDAFALPQGVLPNTVYPAYAPASSLTLAASVTGGTAPYSYNWTNDATTATTTVSPMAATNYSVTVEDQNGCIGTASKTVNVVDVSSGKKGDKIYVCHKGWNTLSIGVSGVADHLGHGDMLGSCTEAARSVTGRKTGVEENAGSLAVLALPNPSTGYFDLRISGKAGNNVQVRVFDLLGRIVETRSSLKANQTIRFGAAYNTGIYMVEIVQGSEKQTVRLVKGL